MNVLAIMRFIFLVALAIGIHLPGLTLPARGQSLAVGQSPAVEKGSFLNLSALIPESTIKIERDVVYSNNAGRAARCDIYSPKLNATPNNFPVVIVVHGGGWVSGDKWVVDGYARRIAQFGIVAVSINYRHAPKFKFPCQVDDVREAMIWVVKNAQRYSMDTTRLGLFGYSAGGHLSLLVASVGNEPMATQLTTSNWAARDPRWKKLPKVASVCIGGPPSDFQSVPPDNSTLAFFLGGSRKEKPGVYVAASPIAHLSKGDPPTLIIHGKNDLLVPFNESVKLHQQQKKHGIESRFLEMPLQGHMSTFLHSKTRTAMIEHFEQTLVQKSSAGSKKHPEVTTTQ